MYLKVALRPHSAKTIVTYFPAYFDELCYILHHYSRLWHLYYDVARPAQII